MHVRTRVISLPLALLLASGVFVLPAHADTPVPAKARPVNAHDLGIAEARLRFCSRVDHTTEPKLKEKVKLLMQGASREMLDRIRRSEEYLKAHESLDAFAAKIDEHNYQRFCSESPAESR
jgi:hypothetical protein